MMQGTDVKSVNDLSAMSSIKQNHRKRRETSEPRLRGSRLNCLSPCSTYQSPLSFRKKSTSISSSSLTSKSSTLSSTKSESSTISITTTTSKTPLMPKNSEKKVKADETVTIKCQRLNIHKELEEVEIEVPANVFNNLHGGTLSTSFKFKDVISHIDQLKLLAYECHYLMYLNYAFYR